VRTALIVEDSITERTLLTAMATRQGLYAIQAADAAAARERVEERTPDLILLDIHLPDTDGLSLLSHLREELPFVPVVIVSSTTDPDIVDEALRLGAVNFLHKPVKLAEFQFVVNRISRVLEEQEDVQEVLASVTERSTEMILPGDPQLLPNVVAYLGREVCHHYPGHPVPLPDIKLALYEALANAVEHGNLEIGYDTKDAALNAAAGLPELIAERLRVSPYSERRVHVAISYRPNEVEYRVRDEGKGFDPTSFDMEHALANPELLHGRGLALIRHYMTEVSWHDGGREIRMVRDIPPIPRTE
jgi:DNA-binding response OmpR family regulator